MFTKTIYNLLVSSAGLETNHSKNVVSPSHFSQFLTIRAVFIAAIKTASQELARAT